MDQKGYTHCSLGLQREASLERVSSINIKVESMDLGVEYFLKKAAKALSNYLEIRGNPYKRSFYLEERWL